jgi:hypothetical protein
MAIISLSGKRVKERFPVTAFFVQELNSAQAIIAERIIFFIK